MSREDANMFKGFCFRIKFKESGTKKMFLPSVGGSVHI